VTRWFWITILAWVVGGIAVIHIAALLGALDHLPIWLCGLIGLVLGVGGLILAMWMDWRAQTRREGKKAAA